jgi:hypothetical protein
MARPLQSEASEIAVTLGIEGEDWVGITDGPDNAPFDVILKYVNPLLPDQLHKKGGDPDSREADFVEAHVAYPSVELVRARVTKRPLLRTRLRLAALELYGNVTDIELGKAELSSAASSEAPRTHQT